MIRPIYIALAVRKWGPILGQRGAFPFVELQNELQKSGAKAELEDGPKKGKGNQFSHIFW